MSPRNGPGSPIRATLPEWAGSPDSSGPVFRISSVTTVRLFDCWGFAACIYRASPAMPEKTAPGPGAVFPGKAPCWSATGSGVAAWPGSVEVNEPSLAVQLIDVAQQRTAVGVSGPLAGGATSHCLRGEASFTRTEVESSATLANLELDVSRVRPVTAGSRVRNLPE